MIPRVSLPTSLEQLARRQARAVSREQLLGHGVSDRVIHRMTGDGTLDRLCRGVYATGEGGWLQLAWAGLLMGGQHAVLGGAAAAYLHGLIGEPPRQITVHTPNWRTRDARWRLVRSPRVGVGEPSRTRLPQTVVDLAAELEADAIVALVAEALGRRRVRARDVLEALQQTARHPNREVLSELVAEVSAGSLSPLELRYARDVERVHGLPGAVRQASPLRGYATDAWYPGYAVAVELDGRRYHTGRAALDDMDRDNDHALVGVITLRFGWQQVVGSPCAVAAKVARALQNGGWNGSMGRCRRCRAPL